MACRLLEHSREAVLGRPVEALVEPEHALARIARKVLASGIAISELEQQIERRGGERVVVDIAASPLFAEVGRRPRRRADRAARPLRRAPARAARGGARALRGLRPHRGGARARDQEPARRHPRRRRAARRARDRRQDARDRRARRARVGAHHAAGRRARRVRARRRAAPGDRERAPRARRRADAGRARAARGRLPDRALLRSVDPGAARRRRPADAGVPEPRAQRAPGHDSERAARSP